MLKTKCVTFLFFCFAYNTAFSFKTSSWIHFQTAALAGKNENSVYLEAQQKVLKEGRRCLSKGWNSFEIFRATEDHWARQWCSLDYHVKEKKEFQKVRDHSRRKGYSWENVVVDRYYIFTATCDVYYRCVE